MLNKHLISELLDKKAKNLDIYLYETVSSTNDLAKEFAKNNPGKEAVIFASTQTAGRGRMGRSFYSPNGTGLYMSIVLRPSFLPQSTSLLMPYAALCVANAIESVSHKSTEIKWINDVYIGGKKVSGILCEASFSQQNKSLDYVIVGIGINLSNPTDGFPVEIKDIAFSVFGDVKPPVVTVHKLVATIINHLYSYSSNLISLEFIQEYKNKLCMLDSEINVITPKETYIARAVDIDNNAHLIVVLPDGSRRSLDAGEISIRKKEC